MLLLTHLVPSNIRFRTTASGVQVRAAYRRDKRRERRRLSVVYSERRLMSG